jgi:hypothetical protein
MSGRPIRPLGLSFVNLYYSRTGSGRAPPILLMARKAGSRRPFQPEFRRDDRAVSNVIAITNPALRNQVQQWRSRYTQEPHIGTPLSVMRSQRFTMKIKDLFKPQGHLKWPPEQPGHAMAPTAQPFSDRLEQPCAHGNSWVRILEGSMKLPAADARAWDGMNIPASACGCNHRLTWLGYTSQPQGDTGKYLILQPKPNVRRGEFPREKRHFSLGESLDLGG